MNRRMNMSAKGIPPFFLPELVSRHEYENEEKWPKQKQELFQKDTLLSLKQLTKIRYNKLSRVVTKKTRKEF